MFNRLNATAMQKAREPGSRAPSGHSTLSSQSISEWPDDLPLSGRSLISVDFCL